MADTVNDTTFAREVLQAEGPVLVDFHTTWCPPCRALAPTLDELSADFQGRARVVKVDVEESPDCAGQNRVTSVPTLVLYANGEPVRRWVGLQPKRALAAAIEAHLPPAR